MSPDIGEIRPDEFSRLYELVAEQHDPEDVHDARAGLEGAFARPGDWLAARVDGALAAFAVVVPMGARIGEVHVPALAVELVTTAPDRTGRGLQRALFGAITERHPDRPLHLIEGIPYFYRRLGYEYAIPHPTQQVVTTPRVPEGWDVRVAGHDDVPLLVALQSEAQSAAGVAFSHPDHLWHWMVDSPVYRVVIASSGGESSMARGYGEDEAFVMEVAGASTDGLRAAISGAASGSTARVYHRPGVPAIAGLGGDERPSGYAYYARIVDPPAVLGALRPEFDALLEASPLAGWTGTFLLSTYHSSITMEVSEGRFGRPEVGGPMQAPVAAGGSGVPPDLLAHLLVGPLGAEGLATRHPDVLLGRQADLMGVLFPPRTADVHTWVAP